jgi:Family of unknown function (DUF5677)
MRAVTTTGREGRLNLGEQGGAALWLAYLGRIIACAKGIAETMRIKGDDAMLPKLLAAYLLARSISTARAIERLIGLGHAVEARMLTRSVFENAFYLSRLAQDDGSDFARQMQDDDDYYRGRLGKTILTAVGGEVGPRVEEVVRELLNKNPNARALKLPEVISGGEIEAAYALHKQLSFDTVHPSITALERHKGTGPGGLSLKPQIKDGEANTASLASKALLYACLSANTALGGTTWDDRLVTLIKEHNDLAARFDRRRAVREQL